MFPKTGVSGPKISPNRSEIAMKSPRTSVDLYKNFLIFLNLKISIFIIINWAEEWTSAQS